MSDAPTFTGRLYGDEFLGGMSGNWVRRAEYDALKEDYRARPSIQSYADQVARVQALESRIRDLEACVLEYWHAKDWAAVGAADATAAKLLPADMKARAALAPAVAKEQP